MSTPDTHDIDHLIELFDRSDWQEMYLKTAKLEVFLSQDPTATGPTTSASASPTVEEPQARSSGKADQAASQDAPSEQGMPQEVPAGMVAVTAPNLGTFYRAPKPGAAPYVEVGQAVDADTEVCLIEVMKLFTPVRAGVAGIVREIRVDDGQMVEFEQALVIIEPAT